MSSVFVVVYDIWRGPVVEAGRYYFRQDSEQPPVVETNVHFIAKFQPVKYNFFRFTIEGDPDIEPPVIETNPHFVGTFKPVKLQQFLFNIEDNFDVQPFPIVPGPIHRPPLFIPEQNGYPATIWLGS